MKHMTVQNNIPARPYFLSILVLGTLLFSLFSLIIDQHYEAARDLTQTTLYNYDVARQSRKILMDLVDMETGVRGYLLTGQGWFLDPYKVSEKMIGRQIEELRAYKLPKRKT